MKQLERDFCMRQFKPAIAVLAFLVAIVLAWTVFHTVGRHKPRARMNLSLAAATAPTAKAIGIKDKMAHPYWGNCNKCHVTTNVGNPVSHVMTGPPISINQKMTHKYWGNCMQCHQVTDGIKQPKNTATAAAFNRQTDHTLGLEVQSVGGQVMRQMGLGNEDGALILKVAYFSPASKAGLKKGDEILFIGKTRIENAADFQTAIAMAKPGQKLKFKITRGKKSRNIFVKVPDNFKTGTLAVAPMYRNRLYPQGGGLGLHQGGRLYGQYAGQAPLGQARTFPLHRNWLNNQGGGGLGLHQGGQLYQPYASQAPQRQARQAAATINEPVAVAATGPRLNCLVSPQFETSPYFVVYGPSRQNYRIVANPNVNDATGKGVQTGQFMIDIGAGSVIAGSYNQNAVRTLKTLKVNIYSGVTGTVQGALDALFRGEFRPTNGPGAPSQGAGVTGVQPGNGNTTQRTRVIF